MAPQDWPTDWEISQDDQVDGIPQLPYQLPVVDGASEEVEQEEEGE